MIVVPNKKKKYLTFANEVAHILVFKGRRLEEEEGVGHTPEVGEEERKLVAVGRRREEGAVVHRPVEEGVRRLVAVVEEGTREEVGEEHTLAEEAAHRRPAEAPVAAEEVPATATEEAGYHSALLRSEPAEKTT